MLPFDVWTDGDTRTGKRYEVLTYRDDQWQAWRMYVGLHWATKACNRFAAQLVPVPAIVHDGYGYGTLYRNALVPAEMHDLYCTDIRPDDAPCDYCECEICSPPGVAVAMKLLTICNWIFDDHDFDGPMTKRCVEAGEYPLRFDSANRDDVLRVLAAYPAGARPGFDSDLLALGATLETATASILVEAMWRGLDIERHPERTE